MFIRLAIGALFLCGISCKNLKTSEHLISNNDYKYWLVVEDKELKKSSTIYYFDSKGKWEIYTKLANGYIEKFNPTDIVIPNKWTLLNDSSIEIGGRRYRIEKLNRNEFVYSYEDKTVTKLIEASDSITSVLRNMQSK